MREFIKIQLAFPLTSLLLVALLFSCSSKLYAAEEWLHLFPSADNQAQQGFVRITNVGSSSGLVTITGTDDAGVVSSAIVTFNLNAGETLHFNSQDLENGNTSKGLIGNLDNGTGSWRLRFSSDLNLAITGLFRNATGFVNTIHQTANTSDGLTHSVPFFNPASNTNQASRLRLINTTDSDIDFEITGTDDAGIDGDQVVTLSIAANVSVELTSIDLENGSASTTGSFGDGSGKWYLSVVSSGQAKVMSLLEDPGGNLSNLSLPAVQDSQDRYVLNYVLPNGADAQSFVRIVNQNSSAANITVTGIDDAGNSSAGDITINLAAREAINFRSEFFEDGNTAIGLLGSLGNGQGNWRLIITSDQDIDVMGLFRTPEGFLNTTHDNASAVEATIHVISFFNPGSNTNQKSVLRLNNLTPSSNTFSITGIDDTGTSPGGAVERTLGSLQSLEVTAAELESSGLGEGTGKWQLTVTSTELSSAQSLLLAPNNFQSNLSSRAGSQAAIESVFSTNTWTPGVFEADGNFKSLCEAPRTGFSEVTGNAFPDIFGSTLDENNWLRSWINDTYLWYDEVTDRDPSLYTTEEYFPLLKTEAVTASGKDKDQFHFALPTDEWEALALTGSSSGYGATIALLSSFPPREVVVLYTQPGSSAASANLGRGARILEIDGADLVSGNDVHTLNAGLFPGADGETHNFVVRDFGTATSRKITMTSGPVTSAPVLEVTTIDTSSGKVGYILFNDHIATAEKGLMDAINQLQAENIADLVLDLRYNGGGFLYIASQMAYMIAGSTQSNGRIFEALQFNDKHPVFDPVTGNQNDPVPFYNTTLGFSVSAGTSLPSLSLPRLYVLTTSNTCSASESIINSLRGIDVEVVLIGSSTCGKPYGFYPTDNCGTTYFNVQFQAANDKGFGDFADGFAPSDISSLGSVSVPGCFVNDDFESPFGDIAEPMLAMALQYRETGTCVSSSSKSQQTEHNKTGAAASNAVMIKSEWLKNKIVPRAR